MFFFLIPTLVSKLSSVLDGARAAETVEVPGSAAAAIEGNTATAASNVTTVPTVGNPASAISAVTCCFGTVPVRRVSGPDA